MKDTETLDGNFAELEGLLLATRASPGDGLRGRTLATVQVELDRHRRQSWWNYAAGLAAALLIGLNLSIALPHELSSLPSANGSAGQADLDAAADSIHQTMPDVSAAEIRRELVLLQAGSHLLPWKEPQGSFPLNASQSTN
jgi:hypothetical protein